MSDDKKNKQQQTAPSALSDLPRGIPVAVLRFTRPMQVPGRQSDETLKADKQPNGREWIVEYIPQIRHHKITFLDNDRQKEPRIGFVHESHVLSWEPAL